MILFIAIAVCILFWTLSGEDGLIAAIRADTKKAHPICEIYCDIFNTVGVNLVCNIVNWCFVILASTLIGAILIDTSPKETSQWQFNINALQDNMGVEGRFRYGGRGYINDELSYYYSRTMSKGEIIEHIPADKTYIRYSDTEKPHVEVHQYKADIPDWVCKVFFINWMNNKVTDYYVIVAPEGTITTTGEYEIDMR